MSPDYSVAANLHPGVVVSSPSHGDGVVVAVHRTWTGTQCDTVAEIYFSSYGDVRPYYIPFEVDAGLVIQSAPVEDDATYLTTHELADALGVGLSTVYAWAKQGRGPRRSRVGWGRYAYREADVLDWLADEPVIATVALHRLGVQS